MKTFSIITFGCRTNQAESRLIGEQLTNLAMQPCSHLTMADIVILNSCAVTVKAEKEVRQAIRTIKRENPGCFLVVSGCWVSKTQSAKLKAQNHNLNVKTFEKIDLVVENKDKMKIGDYCSSVARCRLVPGVVGKFNRDSFSIPPESDSGVTRRINYFQDKYARSGKALVKIQDGCDNFCTYCIVPYLRGRSKSRPAEGIIKEINGLVKRGIKEVILTGVDIADYRFVGADPCVRPYVGATGRSPVVIKNDLVRLLLLILAKTKVKKISFGSINPGVFDKNFLNFYVSSIQPACLSADRQDRQGRCPVSKRRLTTHFHIPLQSGCDATLRRMGRRYKIFNFQFSIFNLKRKIPGFSFSTDIIVGFPGETEEEFEESLRYLRSLKGLMGESFTKIHVFRYSPRPGTAAYKMLGKKGWKKVDEKIKKERAKRIAGILGG